MSEDIKRAVSELRRHLGYPPWLSAMGVGLRDHTPTIVVYLTSDWKPPELKDSWQGYPVVYHEFGSFAPLGGPLPR